MGVLRETNARDGKGKSEPMVVDFMGSHLSPSALKNYSAFFGNCAIARAWAGGYVDVSYDKRSLAVRITALRLREHDHDRPV
jgi:hypothetical protein